LLSHITEYYVQRLAQQITVAVKQLEEHYMVKSSGTKSTGTSRIRFILVDAELHDGDIGPITQAIQNALRGPSTSTVQRLAPISSAKVNSTGNDELDADVEDVDDDVNENDEPTTPTQPKRTAGKRVAPTPNVIDMDEDSASSLKSFMQQANPKSQHKRYLAIATWFHDLRQTKSIGVDHVYTCYRIMGWSTSINDFGQPFRELKHLKFFKSPEKGKFDINHIGLAKAKETGANGE
jgi:hypothetical protein